MGLTIREAILLGAAAVLASILLVSRLLARSENQRPYAYLYRLSKRKLVKAEITASVFRIGRHPHNELRLSDRSVSRFHAEIIRNINGSFTIYDADSKNGIRIGRRPVHSSILKAGDLIDIGRTRFRFTKFPRDYYTFSHTEEVEATPTRFDHQRRRIDRQEVVFNVRVYHDESGWIRGRVRDLSTQGAFIEVERQIIPRAPVDVVFPVVQDAKRRWLHLSGEVVRKSHRGVGVSFNELDNSAARILSLISKAA